MPTETGFGPRDALYTTNATSVWTAGATISTAADLHTSMTGLSAGDLISSAAFTEMTDAPAWR